jgi:hypothetical protein
LNSYDDGEIGESYLGMIKNFSTRVDSKTINVDTFINLTKVLGKKTLQKIESIAVESSIKGYMIIHLAADNDNGESTLFKMQVKFLD